MSLAGLTGSSTSDRVPNISDNAACNDQRTARKDTSERSRGKDASKRGTEGATELKKGIGEEGAKQDGSSSNHLAHRSPKDGSSNISTEEARYDEDGGGLTDAEPAYQQEGRGRIKTVISSRLQGLTLTKTD